MYNYSPIKKIYVKNFRNIGEVEIDFTESPIVSLIGENEAGKTSVVKAFAVAALHAYSRDQKGFIRDGTNGFGVCIELADGSKVTRLKTSTLNKYTVEKPNGEVWDTNKIDAGLPVEVQSLMGLIEEPETKEFLQIRTYEDKLLFVVTPASTNYKVMYDALKVDQLTRAIKIGNREANDLKASLSDIDASVRTLSDNLRTIKTIDLEPVINIKDRITKEVTRLKKVSKAKEIKANIDKSINSLGAISLIDTEGLSQLDLVRVEKLVGADRVLKNLEKLGRYSNNYSKLNTLDTIDITTLVKMDKLLKRKMEIEKDAEKVKIYKELESLGGISEYTGKALQNALNVKKKLDKLLKLDNALDASGAKLVEQADFDRVNRSSRVMSLVERNNMLYNALNETNDTINQINDYLKRVGAAVSNCPKCGETVVMETGGVFSQ